MCLLRHFINDHDYDMGVSVTCSSDTLSMTERNGESGWVSFFFGGGGGGGGGTCFCVILGGRTCQQ